MKIPSTILVTCLLLTTACQSGKPGQEQAAHKMEIPELLERPQLISPPEEVGAFHLAYQELKAKLQVAPENGSAWLDLAELFMREARISGEHGYYYPHALEITQHVLDQEPGRDDEFRALCDKASLLLSQHRFRDAYEAGQKALSLNPRTAAVHGILVDALVELGRYEEAVAQADRMIAIRPDLRSYSRVSYLREIHGQVEGAIDAMKMAVQSGYPGAETTEWARLTLGELYQKYGYPDSARQQYRLALAARPNYPFANAALAKWEVEFGSRDSGIAQMQAACEQIPEVGFFINRAEWARESGDEGKLASLTEQILQMLHEDVESGHQMNLELADVQLNLLEDPSSALEFARREYEARPDNIDVNALMARILYAKGEAEEARPYLVKALRTGSKDPSLDQMKDKLLAEEQPQHEKAAEMTGWHADQ